MCHLIINTLHLAVQTEPLKYFQWVELNFLPSLQLLEVNVNSSVLSKLVSLYFLN